MKKTTWIFGLGLLLTIGCSPRGVTIRNVTEGDAALVRNQPVKEIYFIPFETEEVVLKGDHGSPQIAEDNKRKWFSHVVVGAQNRFNKDKFPAQVVFVKPALDAYDKEVMSKYSVKIVTMNKVPPGAITISGKYISSENISGTSRAFLGGMSGKSWTRARVALNKGDKSVYSADVDGKYWGDGWSWGYETLGANEGLGAGISEIVEKLNKGEKIESK